MFRNTVLFIINWTPRARATLMGTKQLGSMFISEAISRSSTKPWSFFKCIINQMLFDNHWNWVSSHMMVFVLRCCRRAPWSRRWWTPWSTTAWTLSSCSWRMASTYRASSPSPAWRSYITPYGLTFIILWNHIILWELNFVDMFVETWIRGFLIILNITKVNTSLGL